MRRDQQCWQPDQGGLGGPGNHDGPYGHPPRNREIPDPSAQWQQQGDDIDYPQEESDGNPQEPGNSYPHDPHAAGYYDPSQFHGHEDLDTPDLHDYPQEPPPPPPQGQAPGGNPESQNYQQQFYQPDPARGTGYDYDYPGAQTDFSAFGIQGQPPPSAPPTPDGYDPNYIPEDYSPKAQQRPRLGSRDYPVADQSYEPYSNPPSTTQQPKFPGGGSFSDPSAMPVRPSREIPPGILDVGYDAGDQPIPQIVQAPEQGTAPGAQQLSVGASMSRQPVAGVPPDAPSDFPAPSTAAIPRLPGMDSRLVSRPSVPVERPNYTRQQFGEGIGAGVDRDGRPKYVPDLPIEEEDPGIFGRRVAGLAWLFYAMLLALTFFLLTGGEGMQAGMVVAGPVMLVGILMLTGARWSGIMGIVLAVIYSLGFMAIGLLFQAVDKTLTDVSGISVIPPELGFAFAGLGTCFIAASLMMLVKGPQTGRAVSGALLLIIPLVGITTWVVVSSENWRAKLTDNTSTFESEKYGTADEGYHFVKPDGWASYNWFDITLASPLATDLATVPDYYFLNEDQDMLALLYRSTAPRVSISTLFGGENLSEIEKELIRGLPETGSNASEFLINGVPFRSYRYEGIISSGRKLSITMDRGKVGDSLLIIAVVHDSESRRSTGQDAADALDEFIEYLEVTAPGRK